MKVSILYVLPQKVTIAAFSEISIEVLLLIYLHLFLDVPGLTKVKVKVFSYKEMRKATHGFSGAGKIGEGGFGSVFRVICIGHFNEM
jgi:hypothetical protein